MGSGERLLMMIKDRVNSHVRDLRLAMSNGIYPPFVKASEDPLVALNSHGFEDCDEIFYCPLTNEVSGAFVRTSYGIPGDGGNASNYDIDENGCFSYSCNFIQGSSGCLCDLAQQAGIDISDGLIDVHLGIQVGSDDVTTYRPEIQDCNSLSCNPMTGLFYDYLLNHEAYKDQLDNYKGSDLAKEVERYLKDDYYDQFKDIRCAKVTFCEGSYEMNSPFNPYNGGTYCKGECVTGAALSDCLHVVDVETDSEDREKPKEICGNLDENGNPIDDDEDGFVDCDDLDCIIENSKLVKSKQFQKGNNDDCNLYNLSGELISEISRLSNKQYNWLNQNLWMLKYFEEYLEACEEDPERPDLGFPGNYIRKQIPDQESLPFFERYWLGLGDWHLDEDLFNDIVTKLPNSGEWTLIEIDSDNKRKTWHVSISFGMPYGVAFGTFTLYTDLEDKPIGLIDTHDYNWVLGEKVDVVDRGGNVISIFSIEGICGLASHRSFYSEWITRGVNMGSLIDKRTSSYKILYP